MIYLIALAAILVPFIYEAYDNKVSYPKRKIEQDKKKKEYGLK
jgi:hypothetical protein